MRILPLSKVMIPSFVVMALGLYVSFPQSGPGDELTSAALLQYLNQTIGWYRQADLQRQMVADPEEAVTTNDNQQIAAQVVSLAF